MAGRKKSVWKGEGLTPLAEVPRGEAEAARRQRGRQSLSDEPLRVSPTQAVSRRFANLPRSDTAPEVSLRRELHKRGRRYRVQLRISGLPRRSIDVAFPKQHLAVFVDGCFWHGCPEHCVPPRTNSDWWDWKLGRNRARDNDTTSRLEALGWRVLRVWEHIDAREAADLVEKMLVEATD